MSLKHGILGLLSYTPMSGYDLMKVFNESINFFWFAQTSQIYRELNQLEKSGLIESDLYVQKDRPNKKVYALTHAGKEEFSDWIHRISDKDMINHKSSFLMKMFFSSKMSLDRLEDMIKDFRNYNKQQYESLLEVKNNIDNYEEKIHAKHESMFWNLTIENGIICHKGNIEWANYALDLLYEKRKEAYNEKISNFKRKP